MSRVRYTTKRCFSGAIRVGFLNYIGLEFLIQINMDIDILKLEVQKQKHLLFNYTFSKKGKNYKFYNHFIIGRMKQK